jgi:hypothetical protein
MVKFLFLQLGRYRTACNARVGGENAFRVAELATTAPTAAVLRQMFSVIFAAIMATSSAGVL